MPVAGAVVVPVAGAVVAVAVPAGAAVPPAGAVGDAAPGGRGLLHFGAANNHCQSFLGSVSQGQR